MRSAKIEVFRDGDNGLRWHLRASNGKVISESSECYKRTRDVVRSLELTWPAATVRWSPFAGENGGGWELISRDDLIPITVPEGVSLNSRRSR